MNKKISSRVFKSLILIIILVFPTTYLAGNNDFHPFVFMCRIDTVSNPDNRCINFKWEDVTQQIGDINPNFIVIRDLSNDKNLIPKIADTNNDKKPDIISFKIGGLVDDPIKTYEIWVDNNKTSDNILINSVGCTASLITTKLLPVKMHVQDEKNFSWPDTIVSSILKTYPDPINLEIYSQGEWSYTNGFFINSVCELYTKTKNARYKDYAQQWINYFVSNEGIIDTIKYNYRKFELDDILPGRALIDMYEYTGDKKYKTASEVLIDQLKKQPVTSDGGFWHKKVYTEQMWLDGIYMGDVFLAQYGKSFELPEYIDKAIQQTLLIFNHTFDSTTGLLYHGWDESKNTIWSDSIKGTSPAFWGRSIGWYIMALVDILDYVPETHPDRNKLISILKALSSSLLKYQDTNGLWYQVVDKGNVPENWQETSCTAMIAYAYAKGSKKGYLSPDFMMYAEKAFQGLKNDFIYFDELGNLYLSSTVKVGTLNTRYSDGSFSYYTSVERRLNDFKGLVALIYLTMYLED